MAVSGNACLILRLTSLYTQIHISLSNKSFGFLSFLTHPNYWFQYNKDLQVQNYLAGSNRQGKTENFQFYIYCPLLNLSMVFL